MEDVGTRFTEGNIVKRAVLFEEKSGGDLNLNLDLMLTSGKK